MKIRHLAMLAVTLPLLGCSVAPRPTPSPSPPVAAPVGDCTVGIYGSGNTGEGALLLKGSKGFHYLLVDGRRGWINAPDSLLTCSTDHVTFQRPDGSTHRWPLVRLRRTLTQFKHDGLSFAGLLMEIESADQSTPLVIVGHGSENEASIPDNGFNLVQAMLAAQGISAFAFDKRGTGRSEGEFSSNFEVLAADMAAASRAARHLAAGRHGRAGFWGGSQGGWVAPLAATKADADFVAVSFGLVLSPHEEEREEILYSLRHAGFGQDDLVEATDVIDAVGTLIGSKFERGYEHLARLKKRYGQRPWYAHILANREAAVGPEGFVVGDILSRPEADLRGSGRSEFGSDIDWHYDSLPSLRAVEAPSLWIIAGADREAPPEITIARLRQLRAEGKVIDIAVFPETDHGMVEFTEAPDGKRTYGRFADGYFRLMADWIQGRLAPPYGRASLSIISEQIDE